jgi:two-component system response regulator
MKGHFNEILLIEDNLTDAELTARALNEHELAGTLYHIRDGQEALDYLFGRGLYAYRNAGSAPRLILLDLKLPKVSGLEVLRRIKLEEKTCRIPVVVFTSSREERDVVESYDLGVNSFIVKPVNNEEFSQTICEMGLYWLMHNAPSA